jgi:hypothetical protein
MRCYKNGKKGYKWGTYGKCYLDDEGGKDKAIRRKYSRLIPTKLNKKT